MPSAEFIAGFCTCLGFIGALALGAYYYINEHGEEE